MHFGSLYPCLLQLPPTHFLLLSSCFHVPLKATVSVLFSAHKKKELKRTGKIHSQKRIAIHTVIFQRPPERPRKPLFYHSGDNNLLWCLLWSKSYMCFLMGNVNWMQASRCVVTSRNDTLHSPSLPLSLSFSLCPCLDGHLYLLMAKNEAVPFQYTYNVTKKRIIFDTVYILTGSVSLYSFQNVQIFN